MTTTAPPPMEEREKQRQLAHQVLSRKVALTYAHGLQAAAFSLIISLVLSSIFILSLDLKRLSAWLVAIAVVLALRLALNLQYHRNRDARKPEQWAALHTLGTGFTGILWGMIIPLVALSLPLPFQLVLMFLLTIIIAGATIFHAHIYSSYVAFTVPIALPVIIFLAQAPIPLHQATLCLAIGYLGLMLLVTKYINNTLTTSVRLEFERGDLQEKLQNSEERFHTLTENSASAFFIIQQGSFTYVSPMSEQIIGYSLEELQQQSFLDIVHPVHREMTRKRAEARLSGSSTPDLPSRYEIKLLHKNGHSIWVDYSPGVMVIDGEPAILGTVFDITDKKRAEEKMILSEKRFRMLFNMANDPMFLIELSDEPNLAWGNFRDVNQAACSDLGYTREELLAMRFEDISAEDNPNLFRAILAKLSVDGKIVYETEHRTKDGRVLPVEISSHMAQIEEKTLIHSTSRDISLRKQLMEKLTELANTDPLTGCLNRRSFWNRGAAEVDRANRYQRALVLLMVDIDHFKIINDTHGHTVGDLVLRSLVSRCQAELRATDLFGRIGGEEFAALLVETDLEEAHTVAERIRISLELMHIDYGQLTISCTVSIGLAPALDNEKTLDDLFHRADKALYHAKRTGRNRVVAYSDIPPGR